MKKLLPMLLAFLFIISACGKSEPVDTTTTTTITIPVTATFPTTTVTTIPVATTTTPTNPLDFYMVGFPTGQNGEFATNFSDAQKNQIATQIANALDMIPDSVHKKVIENATDNITIYIIHNSTDPNFQYRGQAALIGNIIILNTAYLDVNNEIEFLFTTIHEFGHIVHDTKGLNERTILGDYGRNPLLFDFSKSTLGEVVKEWPPTVYPLEGILGGTDTSYNMHEDFADTFAFYVLWPSKLKEVAPVRYEFMKNLFAGAEYSDFPGIETSAIKDRLFENYISVNTPPTTAVVPN